MRLLPGVKQKGLVSVYFLVMLVFAGVGWVGGSPGTQALPQGSPGETALLTVCTALSGWKVQNCGNPEAGRPVCVGVTYMCRILKEMTNLGCIYKEKA